MELISHYEKKGIVYVTLPEDFGFKHHKEFQKLYKPFGSGTKFRLDFRIVKYIDSSTLGMLLMFRETNGKKTKDDICFINCNPMVQNILKVANFYMLFTII